MSSSMGKLRSLFKRRKSNASTSAGGADPKSPPAVPALPSFINDAAVREEMERVFRKFDSNGDGKISSSELGAIFESLGRPLTEADLSRMIGEADADGDGFIGFEEFVDLNMVDPEAALDDLRDAFSVFDLDRDGKISAEELACVLRRLGEDVSLGHCRQMIAGVDRTATASLALRSSRL
ncbi:putative calcium-binding protein CML25 [Platanthera guangdongensis]|uniref:Calcium-binding protein CML25 n=1 Tax=Platanthera guangdongensis TaxID=2320717 RepID=A0ABR2MDA7_9ASPA